MQLGFEDEDDDEDDPAPDARHENAHTFLVAKRAGIPHGSDINFCGEILLLPAENAWDRGIR